MNKKLMCFLYKNDYIKQYYFVKFKQELQNA